MVASVSAVFANSFWGRLLGRARRPRGRPEDVRRLVGHLGISGRVGIWRGRADRGGRRPLCRDRGARVPLPRSRPHALGGGLGRQSGRSGHHAPGIGRPRHCGSGVAACVLRRGTAGASHSLPPGRARSAADPRRGRAARRGRNHPRRAERRRKEHAHVRSQEARLHGVVRRGRVRADPAAAPGLGPAAAHPPPDRRAPAFPSCARSHRADSSTGRSRS